MRIILVVGKAGPNDTYDRFKLDAENFRKKMVCDLDIPEETISMIFFDSYRMETADAVRKNLEMAILESPNEALCVAYIGHGQDNGWALSGIRDQEAILYEDLDLIFALHADSLIFLNNCCYGGAGARAFSAHGDNSILISPMPATHFGFNYSFLNTLIDDWKTEKFFNPETSSDNNDSKPVVLGNENLQKLFFPKRKLSVPEEQYVR